MTSALLLLACGGPARICEPSSAWDESTPTFRDASTDWGLDTLDLAGVRLSAVDFDDDGWPDLAVRHNDDRIWLLRNTGTGRFEDFTESSGIRATRPGGDGARGGTAWVWADVDNDGDLDVYTGLPEPAGDETSELMLNQGDGTFELGPRNGAVRDTIRAYGAVFTDVDRDGAIDLFLGVYGPGQDRLLMGQGDGTFRDRTQARGLVTEPWDSVTALNEARAHSNAWAVEACDLDADGAPELLASSYGRAPNHLWRNDGSGRFENRSIHASYAFDDNQDWSDNESARCWCALRPDDPDCAGVPAPERIRCETTADAFRWSHSTDREPFRLGGNSGQTVCADLDNDGMLDLITSEIVHWDVGASSDSSQMMRNVGELRFARLDNAETGLVRMRTEEAWNDGDITADAFDFDNDGRIDVYIGATDYPGTRGLLYHNEGDSSFTSVGRESGIDHTRSHGSVAADFDRDGDLDLVVGHSTARCGGVDDCYESPHPRLFENLTEGTNFLQMRLVGGEGTNRAAIGARVEVRTDELLQVQEVNGGGGQFGDQTDLTLHFGLGPDCKAEVTVRWPDAEGSTETFELGGGHRYRIVQGEGSEVVEPASEEAP